MAHRNDVNIYIVAVAVIVDAHQLKRSATDTTVDNAIEGRLASMPMGRFATDWSSLTMYRHENHDLNQRDVHIARE